MILDRLRNERYFTARDNSISRKILDDPECILKLSAKELSQVSFVSHSSVIRFCQKLGFKGYLDFQRQYNYEYGQRVQKSQILATVNQSEEGADRLLKLYEATIQMTRNKLDLDNLKRIIRWVKKTRKIDFYATNQNFLFVQNFCLKLMALNIQASAFNDIHQDYLMRVNPRDSICFVISHTGRNPFMLNIAKTLKNEQFRVVALTGTNDNSLEKLCDSSLYICADEGVTERIQRGISLTYLLDLIYLSLQNKDD